MMPSEIPDTRPTWTDPAQTAPVSTPIAPPSGAPAAPAPTPPTPPAAVAVPARRGSSPWLDLVLGLAAVIAIGGVAFAIGRATAPTIPAVIQGLGGDGTAVFPGGSFDPGAVPGGDGGAGGPTVIGGLGGPSIEGTVMAIDSDSITITLANGETMDIALDESTTYRAASETTADDIAVGDEVSVGVDGFRRGPGVGDDDSAPTARDVTVSR